MTSNRDAAAEARLQEAFAEQEAQLDLPPESTCDADVRTIGVAFAAASKSVSVQMAAPESAPAGAQSLMDESGTSNAQITAVLTGYESLGPENFASEWRDYASDPH